jgi:hypothetical protein
MDCQVHLLPSPLASLCSFSLRNPLVDLFRQQLEGNSLDLAADGRGTDCCTPREADHRDRFRSVVGFFSSDRTRCCLWILGYKNLHGSSVVWALTTFWKSNPRCCPCARNFLVGVKDFPSFDGDCREPSPSAFKRPSRQRNSGTQYKIRVSLS